MTAKKNRPPSLRKQLEMALAGNKALQEQLETLLHRNDACGVEPAPRHATPGGPNLPSDIYPPGCGPMQLVWAVDRYNQVVIGWQGDSFAIFESAQAAVEWLRHTARRIETRDDGKADTLILRGSH
jgi:hypothetical protein